jgi:hypothetical protein
VFQANLRRWRGLSMGMERAGAMPSVENCRISVIEAHLSREFGSDA